MDNAGEMRYNGLIDPRRTLCGKVVKENQGTMEEKQTIKQYIRWFNKKKKLITLILLAAAVGFGALSYMFAHRGEENPQPMDLENGKLRQYVYVDAVGVSDWVYTVGRSTTYYILMDEDHYTYLARIPAGMMYKYSAQRDWFDEKTDVETPVRITGMLTKTSEGVRKGFMEALEIDETEFESYFGDWTLAVGENPSNSAGMPFLILAIVAGGAVLFMLLIALAKRPAEKKAVKRLEERGLLDQAEAELNAPTVQSLKNDRFRLGSRFLFGKGMGLAASWDDVLWCYISRSSYYGFISHNLNVCTADRKIHSMFFRQKHQEEMRELMVSFSERNPEMYLGYTMENRKLYRERTRKH